MLPLRNVSENVADLGGIAAALEAGETRLSAEEFFHKLCSYLGA